MGENMPLFEFVCENCGKCSEFLVMGEDDPPKCLSCGSFLMTKQLSAHAAVSGARDPRIPGEGDTACCGSSPADAKGCAGPGSCCGKTFR